VVWCPSPSCRIARAIFQSAPSRVHLRPLDHRQSTAISACKATPGLCAAAGRDAESPGPAKPMTESPSACRCSRSQAIPARLSATGSSSWPVGHRSHCRRQYCFVDRSSDPHASPGRKLDLDRAATIDPAWRRHCRLRFRDHRRRHETDLRFSSTLLLSPKRPAPLKQQRPRDAVSPRRHRHFARRLQALKHDLELLIFRPASPSARLHNIEPAGFRAGCMTVHKDSSQHHASSDKAAVAAGLRPAR